MTRLFDRALLGLGASSLAAAVVALFAIPHPLGPVIAHGWVWGAVVPGYVVGVFAVILRPEHRSAQWLGRAGALLAIETAGRRYLPLIGDVDPGWWLVGSVALQFAVLATTAAIASVLVVFPDESLRYRYQRRVLGWVWGVAAVLPVLLTLSQPTLFLPPSWFGPTVDNPVFVPWLAAPGGSAERAFDLRSLLWAAGVVAMAARYRRESPELRPRFFWPLTVGCVLVAYDLGFRIAALVTADGVGSPLLFSGWVPGLALLSLSMLVAILRHRLIGASLWLRRSVLFGGTTAIIALAFLGLAGVLGMAVGQRVSVGVGVVATLVAVVASQPARRRLDDMARRWVLGASVAGSELLQRAGETLEDAYDVGQLSGNLADTIVRGLQLEWAQISLSATDDGPSVAIAASGVSPEEPATPDLVVPLSHGADTVGWIACGPKRIGELSASDEELLATVGRQAALAVRNARLTAELERRLDELRRQAEEVAASRSRIVQAQMNERRRIERNIHDGVQQDIVAAMARVRLARNQLARDPKLAMATLEALQAHTARTLENVRELGRGIHPAVLTHRGLHEALDAQVARLPIDVRLEIAPEVRRARYAEDVEAVAYFVVSEGLANVLKHAGTQFAVVRLGACEGWLAVEVIDHGGGCHTETVLGGSGVVGLGDRVESVGGDLTVETSPGSGLLLRARLPARTGAVSHA